MSSSNYKTVPLTTPIDERGRVAGSSNPSLVLIGGSPRNLGRQWEIPPGGLTIGRINECHVHIEEGGLSKHHAKISVKLGKIYITDLGSTNKTAVNGQALAPNMPFVLKNNDQITAGALVFKFLQGGIVSETAEKARMQGELESAKTIQANLFPVRPHATYGNVQIGGRYRSATECGGDWWWHWSAGGKAFALIGDATGHGAGAALVTSAARSAMAMVEEDASLSVEQVYDRLSSALYKTAQGAVVMSAFIVEYTLGAKQVRFMNASHVPAVLLPPASSAVDWKGLKFYAGQTAAPLGSGLKASEVGSIDVVPGSRLVLLTDGLTDRTDKFGKPVSERQFYGHMLELQRTFPADQKMFLNELISCSDQLAKQAPQDDDITVVAMDFA